MLRQQLVPRSIIFRVYDCAAAPCLGADPSLPSQMRLEVKKSKPTSKAFFKVVSKITNAKYMIGSGRGKSRAE